MALDEEFLTQLYKGGELLAAGKIVEAKDHLERAFKLHPKNEKAQNLLGLTYFKLGLFDRAAEIYELLVRENPADPTLRVNLGLVYLKTNNLPRATREFETATDLDPTHKKAHNYLGLALAQTGDYARAREHFIISESAAMADKMARAMQGGAEAPAAVAIEPPPSAPPARQPDAASSQPMIEEASVIVSPDADRVDEVGDDDVVSPDDEVVSAAELSKPRPMPPAQSAVALAEQAQSLGGADKPPLPEPGFEDVPSPLPQPRSSPGVLMADWGAQFGIDAPNPPPSVPTVMGVAEEDDLRFAEDEGPSAMAALDSQPQPTSEAAVATGAQLPVEVASSETGWDSMPVVEAEEVLVEMATESAAAGSVSVPATDSGLQVTVGWENGETRPIEEAQAPLAAPEPEIVAFETQVEEQTAQTEESVAPVEMFPSDPVPADEWASPEQSSQPVQDDNDWSDPGDQPAPKAPIAADSPEWLTEPAPQAGDAYADGGEYQQQPTEQYEQSADQYAPEQPQYEQQYQPEGDYQQQYEPQPAYEEQQPAQEWNQGGYAEMAAPRLEELGPSLDWSKGESLPGPFNLSAEGLALSVNGEILARLPGLLAVAGTIDATPEMRRSRGRATELPFGDEVEQVQRVRGNGVVYLDPGTWSYQAIDLDDEGVYVREERVFAFEESVAFENARLTGTANIAVDVVHLKGQGKVLLKLEGALKAIAIPPGTPLKVPLARLVGWYGHISVRVMGFVGQGAVELTGDGYALLAA